MEENIVHDDLFDYDPAPVEVASKDSGLFPEFKDLIDPVKLRTELELRSIEAKLDKGKTIYNVVISQARMDIIRGFAEKKEEKFVGSDSAYTSAVKGAMGETAIVIILRAFLEIFGFDPKLAKVNLRIHPTNDGGKDHLIGGLRMNSKFSNNPKSGIFFSSRDLDHKNDSDYYVLVNGDSFNDKKLRDPKYGSYPLTISGVVKSGDLVPNNMTHINRDGDGYERWVYERYSLDSLNVMIRDILNNLNVEPNKS